MSEKTDSQELISALRNLAMELGRTPRRAEFELAIKGGKYRLEKYFGGYVALLEAAGLQPASEKPRKIDESIFYKNIETFLEENSKKQESEAPKPLEKYPTLAVISDIHWPFDSSKVIQKFIEYVRKNQPEYVVINGDAWDMYSHSKYPRSHNVFTPREEEALSRKKNEEFWAEIKKVSPESKCIQTLGNHEVRVMKRVLESYPEAEDWLQERMEKMFTFEGVKTIFDPREEVIIGDIHIFHGYRSKLGAHRDYVLGNCINGHTHKGGVVWRTVGGRLIFEANSGMAGDPTAKGLTYTPQRITDWTPGFLAVTEYAPMFIPVF